MAVDVIGLLSIQLFVLQFMMIDVFGLLGIIYIVTPTAFHEGWCGRPVKYIVIHSEFRGR